MPKVSVIIPTYNRANLIGEAIRSVQLQTYADWEVVVADDGSTDNTQEVIQQLNDPRVRYVWQPNQGSSAARNTGVQHATCTYLAFLDSDDTYLPGKLAAQAPFLDEHPDLCLVAAGAIEVSATSKLAREVQPWHQYPALNFDTLLRACPILVSGVLMRRGWFERVNGFDVALRYVEDWDFWLRLAYAGCSMGWQKILVSRYEFHGANKATQAQAMVNGTFAMMDKFFAQPDLSLELRAKRDAVYANAHLDSIVRYLAVGMVAEGQSHLASAIRLDPSLAQGDPPAVIVTLASAASANLVTDTHAFVQSACQALKGAAPQLARTPKQLMAAVEANCAFDQRAHQNLRDARQAAARALWLDPSWLRNRGLLRILMGR